LRRLPPGLELAAVLAAAEPRWLAGANGPAGARLGETLADRLRRVRTVGGQDNRAALLAAWDLAAARPGGVVLWVHAPQPVDLGGLEALQQRYERSPAGPSLLELQTAPGPNRIVEQLDGFPQVRSVRRLGSLGQDLERLFSGWKPGARHWVARKEHRDTLDPAERDTTVRTSLHLARLWAREEVHRLLSKGCVKEAVEVSARFQLVTRVSGAVVLENQAQYDRAGLQPADPATVPAIPEPSTWILLGAGLLALLAHRRVRRHAHQRWSSAGNGLSSRSSRSSRPASTVPPSSRSASTLNR
jgi:hypothetical protein